MTGEGCE